MVLTGAVRLKMLETLAERYIIVIAENKELIPHIQTRYTFKPFDAAMYVLLKIKFNCDSDLTNNFMLVISKHGALHHENYDFRCGYWLQAHYMLQYYKLILPEELWDDFLDKMSWFPGAAIDRILRARLHAESRRRHLLACW